MTDRSEVYVLFSKLPEKIPEDIYRSYLVFLPDRLRDKHFRYRRSPDRLANLFSKILLLKGLQRFSLDYTCLEELSFTEYDRPYLPGTGLDFNISHSSEYCICAIAQNARVGIDIEQIKDVDFNDFESLMSADQWADIRASYNTTHTFFRYWAIKESVIKADGRGLSIPLTEIEIGGTSAFYERQWRLKDLQIDPDYAAWIASDVDLGSVVPESIDLLKINS